MAFGALFLTGGAFAFGLSALLGVALTLLGLYYARQGYTVWRVGPAVMLANRSYALVSQERYDEALALLDAIPASRQTPMLRKAVAAQRARILLSRSRFDEAIALLDAAQRLPGTWFSRDIEREFEQRMRAVRALVLAAKGELAQARDEAARIDATPCAAEVSAVTALTRALVAARARDGAALRVALTDAHAREAHLGDRLRALLRTLSRMAASAPGSVYRAPARGAMDAPLSPVGEWIRGVLPEAAAFAPRAVAPPAPVDEGPRASDVAAQQVEAARVKAVKAAPRAGWWWPLILTSTAGGCAAIALVAHRALSVADSYAVFILTMVAYMAWATLSFRRQQRAFVEVSRLRGARRDDEADAALKRLTKTRSDYLAAQALVLLADSEETRGRVEAALRYTEQAIGRMLATEQTRVISSDLALPTAMALRGRSLALLGRTDEALAEIERVERDHPAYPHAVSMSLVVRLLVALRTGDDARARHLAQRRNAELALPRNADLLCDMLLARDGVFEADGDLGRILGDLDGDPVLRGWIELAAPGLEAALRGASTGVRIEATTDDAEVAAASGAGGAAAAALRLHRHE